MSSESSDKIKSTDNKTDFVPGNDFASQWRNIFAIMTGRMSPEGLRQYKDDLDDHNEVQDIKRCETNRNQLLRYSPIIRFMHENIQRLGGEISPANIYCHRCDGHTHHSGFDPRYGIRLCANELRTRSKQEDAMAHEMMHAWDHLRFKVDWDHNLHHVACSEIRASSLSGECRFWREVVHRRQWSLSRQHQECVRRRAILSLLHRPGCKGEAHATRIVDDVWQSCFADTRPFDEIYR